MKTDADAEAIVSQSLDSSHPAGSKGIALDACRLAGGGLVLASLLFAPNPILAVSYTPMSVELLAERSDGLVIGRIVDVTTDCIRSETQARMQVEDSGSLGQRWVDIFTPGAPECGERWANMVAFRPHARYAVFYQQRADGALVQYQWNLGGFERGNNGRLKHAVGDARAVGKAVAEPTTLSELRKLAAQRSEPFTPIRPTPALHPEKMAPR